ncbi:MAG TPA: UDP-N-acetylglucosamine 2-epimerase (non-hydrolyzing) [Ruminococcaceae bacterium]|nr:UDP-N-acetylglucosamine 2-epimerase (non-hydrolyzing) [Oscillospiraceae bacterium]
MKIVTVVGARPQFIKAAAVSRVLRKAHTEILVHTGQHYDANMSAVFFTELQIAHPDYALGVGSGTHGKQTGEMLEKIEAVLLKEKPDGVLVYGDTNSTLAAALAAAKLCIPVAHVEAGLRSFNRKMPEEQNRVLTDHLSTLLFTPTKTAGMHLQHEGITQGVHLVGDVMCDALYFYKELAEKNGSPWDQLENLFEQGPCIQKDWVLATIHRAENTAGEQNLMQILAAFEELPYPVIFPVHPRTKTLVAHLMEQQIYRNIRFIQPVGYLQMLWLAGHARTIITDSGGLQKEAYLLNVPCVTVREETEWVETIEEGWNRLAQANKKDLLQKFAQARPAQKHPPLYGNGHAAEKIVGLLSTLKES